MEHQFLPLFDDDEIGQKYNVKMTFIVDVASTRAKAARERPEFTNSSDVWDEMVLMKSMGFDVQLHLHPQWASALYQGDFVVDANWNIGRYDKNTQHIVSESVAYLQSVLRPRFPDYEVKAFKPDHGECSLLNLLEFSRRLAFDINGSQRWNAGATMGCRLPVTGGKNIRQPDETDITKISRESSSLCVFPCRFTNQTWAC